MRLGCHLEDVADRIQHDPHLFLRHRGELTLRLAQVADVAGDVDRQVADTLEADQRLQLVTLRAVVFFQRDVRRDRDDVSVRGVRHVVEHVFALLDAVFALGIKLKELLFAGVVVVQGDLRHVGDEGLGLGKRDGRVGHKTRVELAEVFFDFQIFLFDRRILDDAFRDIREQARERQEQHGRHQSEQTVNIRDTACLERHVPEFIADDARSVQDHERRDDQDRREDIVDDVDHAGADLLRLGTETADQIGGQAVADVDADDDGEDAAEVHAHGARDRLQDTDDRGGTLDDPGDKHAGEESEEIVVFKGYQQRT